MRILVIGASGNIGRLTVEHALAAGHSVTAFARSHRDTTAHPNLARVAGDVMQAEDVKSAVTGHDAVILTFGAPLNWDTLRHQPSLCETGTGHVVQALERAGTGLLVCMTSIGAGNSAGHGRFVFRNVIAPFMLGRIMRDRTAQERVVQQASLKDWVIVRPTELTNGPPAAVRMITNLEREPEPTTITRASVAKILVDLASDQRFDRGAVTISN